MGPIRRGRGRPSSSATSLSSDIIAVESCDPFKKENSKLHHTDEYDYSKDDSKNSGRLIVRRGQSFKIRIFFSRTITPDDNLDFRLVTGRAPRITHGSLIYLNRIYPDAGDVNPVGIKYATTTENQILDAEVYLPVDMGVGQWSLIVRARKGRSRRYRTTSVWDDLVVLFNPWHKGDQVYMQNEKWRNEYVMAEEGKLYYGSSRWIGDMDWYFGQFENVVLDTALKLINLDRMRYSDRNDPVLVSRHMSALVNAQDDDGVLVGNWSGDFSGGKEPTFWIGSVAILKQFLETGPVNFGQCWVFSGVLCSILRTLGLPARSVTNFDSAHDTDANLTIDYHFDENGKDMDNDDSVWNFHVWNDVWMARYDMPSGYGGWQALDATPQETSDNKFQTGPMSVNAIKQGKIGFDYDGPFIYAEVNATKRYWKRIKNSDKWNMIDSRTAAIGNKISTKAVGSTAREDVTHQYKYKEGSPEEKMSFQVARKYVKFTHEEKKDVPKLVDFNINIPDEISLGSDIPVNIEVKNVSSKKPRVFVSVVAKIMQYNGATVEKIYDKDFVTQSPGSISTSLSSKLWLNKVKGNKAVKFFIVAGVEDSDQAYAFQDSVFVTLPKITVKAPKGTNVLYNKKTTINVSFKNPLPSVLTGGVLTITGAGEDRAIEAGKINGNATFNEDITVTPKRFGERKIIVGFSSDRVSGIQGSITLNIK